MAARKDPEEIADAMGVDNAKKAKEDVASEILELELDHADRVSKFNRLHRCLAILLDQNLGRFCAGWWHAGSFDIERTCAPASEQNLD